jgi:hypothetical protein
MFFLYEFSCYTQKLREKVDNANVVLYNLCEGILSSQSTTTMNTTDSISSDIKLKNTHILIDGLKQLFRFNK